MSDPRDYDQELLDDPSAPPPRQGLGANVADAWRTRPMFKLVVLMVGVGALIAASLGFFSSNELPQDSRVSALPSLNEPPGGQSSPAFVEAQKQAAAQRAEAAQREGSSAIPTPFGVVPNAEDELRAKDPLAEFKDELERQRQQDRQQILVLQQQVQTQQAAAPQQFDDRLQQAMQQQMGQLVDNWKPKSAVMVTVSKPNVAAVDVAANGAGGAPAAAAFDPGKTVVPGGTVSYAQLLTEANSDVQGPILAQILSGPLKGARAVGKFQVARDYLVLSFSLATLNGKDYTISALALDPDTTLSGLATEVDNRYFERVLLPAAAQFASAFGSALGDTTTTTTVAGDTVLQEQGRKGVKEGLYSGLGEAGRTIGQFFQEEARATKPLIRVAAGTAMGLFFISSVTENNPQQQPYGYPYPGMMPPYAGYTGGAPMPSMGYMPYAGAPVGLVTTPVGVAPVAPAAVSPSTTRP